MGSKKKIGLGGRWQGALLAAVGPAVLLAFAAGCEKKTEDAPVVDAQAASADPSASSEVAPPPPVVAGDPEIPLNEAVVGTTPVAPDFAGEGAPPAAVEEERPASPAPSNVWVPGYWWWSGPFHRYVWVSGAWRDPPPQQVWTPGMWVSGANDRYTWVPGFWATSGVPRPPAIEVAPPPLRVEAFGASPGVGYVWTPGYYAWREGAYGWLPGSWVRPPGVGYGWVEPRYVGIGGHYYFQPGRWDFPPERRGVCYRPDINIRPGMRFTPVAVPSELVVQHARFVGASAHAIAQGAQRQPNGGYVLHGTVGLPHTFGTPGEHPGGGPGEHPGGGPAGGSEHPGGGPAGGSEHPGGGPGGTGEHPGGGPPSGTGEHPGGGPGGSGGGGEGHPGGGEGHPGGAGSGGHQGGGSPPGGQPGGAPTHGGQAQPGHIIPHEVPHETPRDAVPPGGGKKPGQK